MGNIVGTISTEKPVRVAVVFEKGRIRPVWFEVDNIRKTIKEVCYMWQNREGRALILNFSVSDGQDTFELQYNTLTFVWSLGVVESVERPLSPDKTN